MRRGVEPAEPVRDVRRDVRVVRPQGGVAVEEAFRLALIGGAGNQLVDGRLLHGRQPGSIRAPISGALGRLGRLWRPGRLGRVAGSTHGRGLDREELVEAPTVARIR